MNHLAAALLSPPARAGIDAGPGFTDAAGTR